MNYNWLYNIPIAHRGYHIDGAVENTRTAFQKAIDNNLTIEIDVHINADKEIVVFHDSTLKRVCGVDKNIFDLTTAEMKKARVKGTDEDILTLKEFLDLVDGKVGILLEIKYKYEEIYDEICPKILETIKDYKGKIAIQSFYPKCLSWFKENAPKYHTGFLMTNSPSKNKLFKAFMKVYNKRVNANYLSKLGVDFLAYDVKSLPIRQVTKIKKQYKLLTWTVNDLEKLKVAKNEADNIIFETKEVLDNYKK